MMLTRSTIALTALLGLLALTTGCGARSSATGSSGTSSGSTTETATAPQGEGHGGAGVVPGSHEDWCTEHLVAESQCSRCDPALIPAFQAANDWCAEHGLPMSQCTIHDPNLKIVRPPKPVGQ